MPIRNMGTLLENLVLLEAFRLLSASSPSSPLELANSFAMPPLAPWIDHSHDACFSAEQLRRLGRSEPPEPRSYAGLLWACLQQPPKQPGTVGPNGALLCTLLAAQQGTALRLWLNDVPEGHYGNALPGLGAIAKDVRSLLGRSLPPGSEVVTCSTAYPDSLQQGADSLRSVLAGWPDGASARLGFLDPMRYRVSDPVPGETSSSDHRLWLRLLAAGFGRPVVAVHFTGHRDWARLRPEVEEIRMDAAAEGYVAALTSSWAHYHVLALVRDPAGDGAAFDFARKLEANLEEEWRAWCAAVDHPVCALNHDVRSCGR